MLVPNYGTIYAIFGAKDLYNQEQDNKNAKSHNDFPEPERGSLENQSPNGVFLHPKT